MNLSLGDLVGSVKSAGKYVSAGLTLVRGSLLAGSTPVIPALPIAILIAEIGNSHSGGRAIALGTETWSAKAYQWTQAGALQKMQGTGRYNLEQQAGGTYSASTVIGTAQIGPQLTFSNLLTTARPDVARIVFVPHQKNASSFHNTTVTTPPTAGDWYVPNAASNSLGAAKDRFNAAYANLVSLGYQVEPMVAWHAAEPDYDNAANWDYHQAQIDALVDYCHLNLSGFTASSPVLIGPGMAAGQLTAGVAMNRPYQPNYMSAAMRRPYVGQFDHNNAGRYGDSGANVPSGMLADNVHEDYTSVFDTIPRLRMAAIARAKLNTQGPTGLRKPFHTLSFSSALLGFWDFRTGSGLVDWSGSGNPLTRRLNTSPPMHTYDAQLNEYVWTLAA